MVAGPAGESWRLLRGIARDVREIRPDVFWSATHILPYGLARTFPKVVTLLDLVWRDHPETMPHRHRSHPDQAVESTALDQRR